MNIQWSGELLFFIFVLGVVSLAGVMFYDQYKQSKKKS